MALIVAGVMASGIIGVPSAEADTCPPVSSFGRVDATTVNLCASNPGTQGGPGTTQNVSGAQECRSGVNVIPCSVDGAWWSASRSCYVALLNPQPPADSPFWEVREGGAAYACRNGGGALVDGTIVLSAAFWLPAPPPPGPDPAVLAQQAVNSMGLSAISVGLTPPEGSGTSTVVGLPTWMWVEGADARTFGPNTASSTAGGMTVTATAKVIGVQWDVGDGTIVPITRNHAGV